VIRQKSFDAGNFGPPASGNRDACCADDPRSGGKSRADHSGMVQKRQSFRLTTGGVLLLAAEIAGKYCGLKAAVSYREIRAGGDWNDKSVGQW
jgi:hypothetical protein